MVQFGTLKAPGLAKASHTHGHRTAGLSIRSSDISMDGAVTTMQPCGICPDEGSNASLFILAEHVVRVGQSLSNLLLIHVF
jgi:hypothetical protein